MGLKRKVFDRLSSLAVRRAVRQNPSLQQMWDLSNKVLPGLGDHYATIQIKDEEGLLRLRLLVCAQVLFVKKVIAYLKTHGQQVNSWVDVGDSDGAARLLFLASVDSGDAIKTLGINLEKEAVALIRSKGLEAEHMNAMDLHKKGIGCDLVSVFETLEHLPDPIGFLESMQEVVGQRLLISVPLIVRSRVGLRYLSKQWEPSKKPAYSNNHMFELSPTDWKKLFQHTGWAIDEEWKVRQYPRRGLLKNVMQAAWRRISFEGYWFVSLKKDKTFSNQFTKG